MPGILSGCFTSGDSVLKATYQQLVQVFSPVVFFDPKERFFPVDLNSAVAASTLYQVGVGPVPTMPTKVKPVDAPPPHTPGDAVPLPHLKPEDLFATDETFFTTVADLRTEDRTIGGGPTLQMPIPAIEEIYKKYSDREILAKLTVYASICRPEEVPNYQLLEDFPPRFGSLRRSILISYYFYFPALESEGFKREGDWSGISLLFSRMPDLTRLAESLGSMDILACYFRKVGRKFVAEPDGFRGWKWIVKHADPSSGIETHPYVYISPGVHNCLYEDIATGSDPSDAPWESSADPDKIEAGAYSAGEEEGAVHGSLAADDAFDWFRIGLALVSPLSYFIAGCEDPSPLDRPAEIEYHHYVGATERVGSGGWFASDKPTPGVPASDEYPKGPPPTDGSGQLKLNLQYVDLDDLALLRMWRYAGSWGAAGLTETTVMPAPGDLDPFPKKSRWGALGGPRRPNLAPWFLWDLYLDTGYGSDGGGGYESPGSGRLP